MKSKRKGPVTHGMSSTSEYNSWVNAKNRCHNPKHKRYSEWGGRGIEVCDKWRYDFDVFYRDMGPKPGPGYSLDRIDGDRGYEPGNCRWATAKTQSTNRPRWVNTIEFDGKVMTITDWAIHVGVKRKTLYDRLRNGWPIELALTVKKLDSGKKLKDVRSQTN